VKDRGVPLWYVEGLNDVRTLLADFFSILLGIDQIVLEGAHGRTLAFGPGRLESGSSAKDGGTMILTGHRDTHFSFWKDFTEGTPSWYKLEPVCGIALGCERVRSSIHAPRRLIQMKKGRT
jgi:hypothetical protein